MNQVRKKDLSATVWNYKKEVKTVLLYLFTSLKINNLNHVRAVINKVKPRKIKAFVIHTF